MGIDSLPEIITVKQLAEFLQVSEITIKRAMKANELQAFKVGRDWRVEKDSVIKWLRHSNTKE